MAILPLNLARVSSQLTGSVITDSLAKTQQSLLDVENELSTGKQLNLPSDNPGSAAIAQQLHKLLEQRQAYASNLTSANSQRSDVDSTLGDLTNLVQQAQNIASANVGSDVTSDARQSAAAVIDSLNSQLMSLGNHSFDGMYVFGGDKSTDPPFVQTNGGVQFVGGTTQLQNTFDSNVVEPFMVDGSQVFGALSSRVQGSTDLTPTLSATTRISDLRGASGNGVNLGSIQISDGTNTAVVDLSKVDTIGDVINAINSAGVGSVTASIAPNGLGLQLNAGPSDNISVNEVGGGTTANDLGILSKNGAGAGNPLVGGSVSAKVTPLTPLASLRGGAGIDTTHGLIITNGLTTKTIDLSGATTVEDLLNAINGSGAAVLAQINSAGTGVNILNPTQGTNMTIAENGGTTAADLGVRSFGPGSQLSELNSGTGVRTVTGNDIQLTDSQGVSFQVDLSGLNTIQDVLNAVNTAATTAGAGVTAGFATTGNGITLTDTAGGAGTLALTPLNFSNAAADLGLTAPASGNVITGTDVNPVQPEGIFSHLSALADALRSNNQNAITAAAQGLAGDYSRVVTIRGTNGAKLQEIQSRQARLDDQNVATQSLLSSLEDVDYTSAITQFQQLQTSLQATLQTSSQILHMSLLNFLS